MRKSIPAKLRQKVFARDSYTCVNCGISPAFYPGLTIDVVMLEADHITPVSKNGENELENLQTLCQKCNRGKGDDESFNMTLLEQIGILLNKINPDILVELEQNNSVRVVANDYDFIKLKELNTTSDIYKLQVIPNTIIGYQAMHNAGIYTVEDNYGAKINFNISLASLTS